MEGWVAIHRKITENPIWNVDEPYDKRSAWIDLILAANHEDVEIVVNGRPLLVKRGQKFTSIRKLSERWRWGKDTVRRFISTLEHLQMVTSDGTHNGTLLTIENYSKYQFACDTNRYTNKDTDGTSTGHRQVRRAYPNNNKTMNNNENNEKKEIEAPPLDPWGNVLK